MFWKPCKKLVKRVHAFEVTNSDLTMPEWASGWGRIHFPPVKLLADGE